MHRMISFNQPNSIYITLRDMALDNVLWIWYKATMNSAIKYMYMAPEKLKMPLNPLPTQQQRALVYMMEFFLQHQYYPTHLELLKGLGLKGTAASVYLHPLAKKGYLERVNIGRGRNFQITEQGLEYLRNMGMQQVSLEEIEREETEREK